MTFLANHQSKAQKFPLRRSFSPYTRFLLQVRCNNGSETEVPGVILVIPPPDKKAVQQVQRSDSILFSLSNLALEMVIEIKNRIKTEKLDWCTKRECQIDE